MRSLASRKIVVESSIVLWVMDYGVRELLDTGGILSEVTNCGLEGLKVVG